MAGKGAENRERGQIYVRRKGGRFIFTTLNGRDVYKANDGNLYAVDTQHGRFEVINSKNGKHLGEVDFDFKKIKSADKTGGHDLRVK